MEQEKLMPNQYTRYLVPSDFYDIGGDKRLLIPFTNGDMIGFVNRSGEIVVNPRYALCFGECHNETDFIRVAEIEPYGTTRSVGSVSAYYRYLFGLMDYAGRLVFPVEYHNIKPAFGNKRLYTIVNRGGRHAVMTVEGEEIVPYGRYDYIGGFDNGFARVKIGEVTNGRNDSDCKWGLINEKGDEVLPVEYDNIWNFYGKGRKDTNIVKDGNTSVFLF
mgnify:CR=1 FL=1